MDAVLAVLMDITEKKKAQMELELKKTRYQVLVDCTEAIVYEYDYKKDLMLLITRLIRLKEKHRIDIHSCFLSKYLSKQFYC
jgi:hypothetical protein